MMVRQLMYILLSRGIIHPAKTGKYRPKTDSEK